MTIKKLFRLWTCSLRGWLIDAYRPSLDGAHAKAERSLLNTDAFARRKMVPIPKEDIARIIYLSEGARAMGLSYQRAN